MNEGKQALLDKIKQTYILVRDTQENEQNITDINKKINDVNTKTGSLRKTLNDNEVELSNAKSRSGKFKDVSVPKLRKDKPAPSDRTIYNAGITELKKQGKFQDLKEPDYKPMRKWKWWVYVALFLAGWWLWAYITDATLGKAIQNRILELSAMKHPPEKDVAVVRFLLSNTFQTIELVVGIIIIISLIVVFRKMVAKFKYNQRMSEYKEKNSAQNQLIRKTGEEVIAEQRRHEYQAQVEHQDDMIREKERREFEAQDAVDTLPATIEKNKNQLESYDYIRGQYENYLKQAQKFGDLLKSKKDSFIDVPLKRFGNLNYYADLYEIVRTEQALTAGDAVRLAEDRWERAEQNLALRQEIHNNGVLLQNSIEKGIQTVSGELDTITTQQKMIQTGIENTNDQLSKVNNGISIIDTNVKSGARAITSSIDSSSRKINNTIQSGIAANIASNAYTNSQLEETNRRLDNVRKSVNNTNSQLSRKLPNK